MRAHRSSPRPAVLALLALLSAGCVERFVDFRVRELSGVRVTSIDARGFDLRVRCELENPNALGAEVSGVRFRTWTGEHELGNGALSQPFSVAARSRFSLEVPVRVTYESLPADLPARAAGGAIQLRTEASLRARTSLGSYNMRLSSEGRTRIAEVLRVAVQGPFAGDGVRVDSIALAGLELRRVRLRARLTARNRFAFPIQIRRGTFQIAVNGAPFGKTSLDRPLTLRPRATVSLEMLVLATHGAVGGAIAAMFGAEPHFRVRGELEIDPIGGVQRIPIDVQADSSVFGSPD
jgi:LEA14-like dessication related protein